MRNTFGFLAILSIILVSCSDDPQYSNPVGTQPDRNIVLTIKPNMKCYIKVGDRSMGVVDTLGKDITYQGRYQSSYLIRAASTINPDDKTEQNITLNADSNHYTIRINLRNLPEPTALPKYIRANGKEPEMVLVSPGLPVTGYDSGVHNSNVGGSIYREYYISREPIANDLWESVMPNYQKSNCQKCPVIDVSYAKVCEFVKRLNEKTGKTYALPTPQQWETVFAAADKPKNTPSDDPQVNDANTVFPAAHQTEVNVQPDWKDSPPKPANNEWTKWEVVEPRERKQPNEKHEFDGTGDFPYTFHLVLETNHSYYLNDSKQTKTIKFRN